MKRRLLILSVVMSSFAAIADDKDSNEKLSNKSVSSKNVDETKVSEKNSMYDFRSKNKLKANPYIFREAPAYYLTEKVETAAESADSAAPFKPNIQLGSIVHMYAKYQQDGFGPGGNASSDWGKGFDLYRARVLVGGQLSKKGSFFFETDLPTIIGTQAGGGAKNVEISQLVLDCQYEHKFAEEFQVIAGKQLVSSNRNGLQGAASLMANDFTFFQYPYNMFGTSGLQNNYGRDLGVNFRGLVAKSKLEYRLGFFTGRNLDGKAPLRTVGRLVYNFLDADKSYYFSGTNLGKGKTVSLGGGFDFQSTYSNVGLDLFVDVPVTQMGSVTFNGAFQYMTGGTDASTKYNFVNIVPKQTVQFAELGYYFKKLKLQPYLRFENQAISALKEQTSGADISTFNKFNSGSVFGGGLNYFFNDYGTNLRLSYTSFTKGVISGTDVDKKSFGSIWLQLQFFIF